MELLLEFAGNHSLLVTAFVGVLAALIWNLATDPGGKNAVDPLTATAMINHEDAIILDVRSMAEFKDGHLSLIHISEPTRRACRSRMPSSA